MTEITAPARRRATFNTLEVSQVRKLTADSVEVAFTVPPELVDDYDYLPGQYVALRAHIDDVTDSGRGEIAFRRGAQIVDAQIDRRHHALNLNGNRGMRCQIGQRGDDATVNKGAVATAAKFRPERQPHRDGAVIRDIDSLRPEKVVKRRLRHFLLQPRERRNAIEGF